MTCPLQLARMPIMLCGIATIIAWPTSSQEPFGDHVVRNESEIVVREHDPTPSGMSRAMSHRPARFPWDWRNIDGTENNAANPTWGCAQSELIRMCPQAYEDGSAMPSGADRPGAREISNLLVAQEESMPNSRGLSDMFWQWGQFLDHDMDLVAVVDPSESFDIPVPSGDPFFDPFHTGTEAISLNRSFFSMVDGAREQVNEITAFIDASNIYGADEERAQALRMHDGTGRLKTSAGNMLPFNEEGMPNAPSPDPSFFLAGDVRANEQAGLASMHTLFVREHNYWADFIGNIFWFLGDQARYEIARAIVAAEVQAITYNEFLPLLLGPNALGPYEGYSSAVHPGVANEFATAAYRFGHTMLSPVLLRLDATGETIPEGDIALRDAFFRPDEVSAVGIEPYLRGLASQEAQEVDSFVIDDVRNFLFGPPGAQHSAWARSWLTGLQSGSAGSWIGARGKLRRHQFRPKRASEAGNGLWVGGYDRSLGRRPCGG